MKTVVINVDGTAKVCDLNSLEDLQQAVGGYIEAIALGNNASAYINEEGKLRSLPLNAVATAIAHRKNSLRLNDFIVGPMVILGIPDENGNDTDIPKSLLCELMETEISLTM